jgi:hypothetical protein
MDCDDVILGRRSVRGYKPDPVPAGIDQGNPGAGDARAIVDEYPGPGISMSSPAHRWIASAQGNTERNLAGVPHSREFRTGHHSRMHRERQVGVAKQLFSRLESARIDRGAAA